MRAVVERTREAWVEVEGCVVGRIGRGLLVYLGIAESDTDKDIEYLAKKLIGLRIFGDANGSMNLAVTDVKGSALVVSQFTLLGDVRRGLRPSFTQAMAPDKAAHFYFQFIEKLRELGILVEQGVFGAMMRIHSVNDGPVTILLDSTKLF